MSNGAPIFAATCEHCGDDFDEMDLSPNLEAFEVIGMILCDFCAEELLADNGQFGVGA